MLKIRPATREDVPLILEFIRLLAEYEREPQAAVATEADLLRDGFATAQPKFRVVIAEWSGAPAGFAFFFFNYSTWMGKPGLYLEDLFVKPEFRGKGIGRQLVDATVRAARQAGLTRVELEVFSSNTNAIALYERYGFQHEGLHRRGRIIDGRVEDVLLMGLLLDE